MILEKDVPPKLFNKAKRIALVVDLEWLSRIDEWRKRHGWPPPTVSDSVRQLVDQALELHRLISGRRSRDISNASASGEPPCPPGEKQ